MAPLSRFPPPVTSRHRGRRAIITGGSFGGARHRMPIGIQICSGTEWSPAERVSGCSRRPQRRQPPRAHAEIARLKFHLARYRRAEFGRSSEKLARDTEQPELALEPGAFRPCAHARRRGCQVRARLAAGGRWIRTIGPWRQAVVPSWNILRLLQMPADGLSPVRRCGDVRFRALVKGSMAWLL
jgi:hypothetical protein